MTKYTIERARQYPTPGTNYRFAWKWVYSVRVADARPVGIGSGLGSALLWIRQHSLRHKIAPYHVVKAWA